MAFQPFNIVSVRTKLLRSSIPVCRRPWAAGMTRLNLVDFRNLIILPTAFHSSPRRNEEVLSPQGTSYSSLSVGVPREVFTNERRVALTPQNVRLLLKKGFGKVLVEKDAGTNAQFLDAQYIEAGATLVSREELFKNSDIMLKVRAPLLGQEVESLKEGSTLISFLYPSQNKAIVDALAARKVNSLAVRFWIASSG